MVRRGVLLVYMQPANGSSMDFGYIIWYTAASTTIAFMEYWDGKFLVVFAQSATSSFVDIG